MFFSVQWDPRLTCRSLTSKETSERKQHSASTETAEIMNDATKPNDGSIVVLMNQLFKTRKNNSMARAKKATER